MCRRWGGDEGLCVMLAWGDRELMLAWGDGEFTLRAKDRRGRDLNPRSFNFNLEALVFDSNRSDKQPSTVWIGPGFSLYEQSTERVPWCNPSKNNSTGMKRGVGSHDSYSESSAKIRVVYLGYNEYPGVHTSLKETLQLGKMLLSFWWKHHCPIRLVCTWIW